MIDIAPIFRDVVRKPYYADRNAVRLLNMLLEMRDGDVVELPIQCLYATQPQVNDDFSSAKKRYDRNDPRDLPVIVRYQGKHYISDGHHRITAEHHEGKSVTRVLILNLDGEWEEAPLLEKMEAP